MTAEAAIQHVGVSKRFGNTLAVDHVSFDVPARCLFGLLGPNGAGKTTLFSIVAGFLRPTEGSVEVLGIDVRNISELRGRLSILPQDAQFQSNVPVLEQLVFFSQLNGNTRHDAEKEAENALELVGLADDSKKSARALSHGMTKRMGIAQAFLGKPEVILLDEPTAGLDPANAHGIRELVNELKGRSTVVISSHNLAEIQALCSDVAILDRGKLVEAAPVSEITGADRSIRLTLSRSLSEEELGALTGMPGIVDATSDGEARYLVSTDAADTGKNVDELTAEIVQMLAARGVVPRSVQAGADLEDRFLAVTGVAIRGSNPQK